MSLRASCGGDAFLGMPDQEYGVDLDRLTTPEKDGCAGCARAESNGGRCAGEYPATFMLECLAALGEAE